MHRPFHLPKLFGPPYLVIVLVCLCLLAAGPSFGGEPASNSPSAANQERELYLKNRELSLKERDSQFMRWNEGLKTFFSILTILGGVLAVVVPIRTAAANINAQRRLADERARLDFQMKVAELALTDSANATQAKEKARALATLFGPSKLLPREFAERFDARQFRFEYGETNAKREQLIALLAQYPGARQQILGDWYVMFRWDWWWIEPMLEVDGATQDKLNQRRWQIEGNERRLNEEKAAKEKADREKAGKEKPVS